MFELRLLKMQITVYSTATCPYCKMLKDYLDEKHIEYAERSVDQDDASKEEMSKLSGGFMGVPFTHVSFDDGRQESVVGFDKGKLDSILLNL